MMPPRGHRGAPDPLAGLTAEEQPGAVFAGKFQLLDLLGRGGMGSVWRAQDLMLGRQVAIKFIRPVREIEDDAAAEARVRFEREARAVALLRTRHVVQIYEYGFHGDTPYIVMELLTGETLGQRLERHGRLPPAHAARILDQAARALELAHASGIVHRDLKPANIFLAREDNEEIVKILDFGVAKASGMELDGDNTATGRLVGSPYYMSPEQARGVRNLDGRSDLWSMAVILFRALTGEKVFSGDSLGAVMVQILREPIPLPSHFVPELPGPIDRFFERALARDPAYRFQTAGEMAQAFNAVAAYLSGEVWPAPPYGGDPASMPTPSSLSGMAPSPMSRSGALTSPTAALPALPALPGQAPSAAPLSVTSHRAIGPGMTLGHGTLTHVPWSPRVRRALWAAAGFGAAMAVVGLVLIARVALTDDPPAEVSAVSPASPPGAVEPAPAQTAAPTAAAVDTAAAASVSAGATAPATAQSGPPEAAAAPDATAAPGEPPEAATAAPTASAAPPPPRAPAPPRPPAPKQKPKWY